MSFMIFIKSETNWDGNTFFLFKFSTFGKIKSIDENFTKTIQLSFLFANITNKMANLTSSTGICFVSSDFYEIHETVLDGH